MSRRFSFSISDEAWKVLEAATTTACQGFNVGTITSSDVLNEMILSARINVDVLRLKHTDLRKSLRVLASEETVDLDSVLKTLQELKDKQANQKKCENASTADEGAL